MTVEPFSHTASDWATVAVGVLAGVTIFKAFWDDRRRQKEREEDRREREDVAYATVHAEYFRIWTVSEQWRTATLVNPAVIETMSPEDILPRPGSRCQHTRSRIVRGG